jgi:hypothetical protein
MFLTPVKIPADRRIRLKATYKYCILIFIHYVIVIGFENYLNAKLITKIQSKLRFFINLKITYRRRNKVVYSQPILSFLPLGAIAQGELWSPEQSASILLYSSSTGPSYLPCHIYFILEADYLVSQQFNFYGVRLLASRPTPNLGDQSIPLCLAPTPWPVRHGWLFQ